MFRGGISTAAALMFAFSACAPSTSDTPPSEDAAGHRSPPASTESVDPREPNKILQDAIDPIMTEDVTDFRFEWTMDGHRMIVVEGFADVRTGWEATAELQVSESVQSRTMHAVSSHDAVWMQMADWPAERRGCWLEMATTQVPLGIQGLAVAEPGYIRILSTLEADDATGGTLTGTLSLRAALSLLQAQTMAHIDIAQSKATASTVPARFEQSGGRLTQVSLRFVDIMAAVAEAGGSVAPAVKGALGASELTLDYGPHSGDASIETPTDDLVVSPDRPSCHQSAT